MDVLFIPFITVPWYFLIVLQSRVLSPWHLVGFWFFLCWLSWATYLIAAFGYPCHSDEWEFLHVNENRFWPKSRIHFTWPSLLCFHITTLKTKKISMQYPSSHHSSPTPCSGSCVLFLLHPSVPPDQPDSSPPSSNSWLSASQNESKDRDQPSVCSSTCLQINVG